MSERMVQETEPNTGYFNLLSSLDTAYTKDVLDTDFSKEPPKKELEELYEKLPIHLSYYVYHRNFGYILGVENICTLYLSHTSYLLKLSNEEKICKERYLVSQDVLDRFFLNVYLRVKRDKETQFLEKVRDTLVERWMPICYKMIEKRYESDSNKHPHQIKSDAAIYIIKRLKQISRNDFFVKQQELWNAEITKLLDEKKKRPILKVYPFFIGNLKSQEGYSLSKSVYAERLPVSKREDSMEDIESNLEGYETVIGENDEVQNVKIERPYAALKQGKKLKYELEITVKYERKGGLKSPLDNKWIIPPPPPETLYFHISKVANDYGLSKKQIRRYIEKGVLKKLYVYLKYERKFITKLLYIEKSSLLKLERWKNWKSWIDGVVNLKRLDRKSANNYIRYWIKKKIREDDFFHKEPFSITEYEKIIKEYRTKKYKRVI